MSKGFLTCRWSWWLQHYSTGENKVKLPEQCQKAFLHPDGPGGCSATVEVRTNEVKHQHEQFPTSHSLVAGRLESCCTGENK